VLADADFFSDALCGITENEKKRRKGGGGRGIRKKEIRGRDQRRKKRKRLEGEGRAGWGGAEHRRNEETGTMTQERKERQHERKERKEERRAHQGVDKPTGPNNTLLDTLLDTTLLRLLPQHNLTARRTRAAARVGGGKSTRAREGEKVFV
jgi:hypothetical protein